MNLKDIISWDLIVSLLLAGVSYYTMPKAIPHDLALTFYNTGVTVLSILFSVYFAALAIILSSSSDDFVKFLEKDGSYTSIIALYKYTIGVLFAGLVFSIIASMVTAYLIKGPELTQSKFFSSTFIALFFYGVFCSYNSAKDAILYSMYRLKFLGK